MATADFTIKAHDTLPSIQAALVSGGTAVDLTSATGVSFIMKSAVGNGTATKSAAVIVAPATGGVVRYDWTASDTATPGDFLAEWEVTWAAGKKQTFPTLTYHTVSILADLDVA